MLFLSRLSLCNTLRYLVLSFAIFNASADSSAPSKPALPRSVNFRSFSDGGESSSPALLWNPSSQIDREGFLARPYVRIPSELEVGKDAIGGKHCKSLLTGVPVRIRQVPGDGNCLFHSLTICLSKVENGTHFCYDNNMDQLREHSRILRERAVDYLASKPKRLLYLQGREYMRARDLIETAASPYGCTPEEYCETMRQESFWGGGPEVVALCNLLKRPIHIYELYPYKKNREEFRLRRMACFGSPRFDRKEALHILSADSRFPDVVPGKQLAAGNHFLAVFPVAVAEARTKEKRKRIRGGGVNPYLGLLPLRFLEGDSSRGGMIGIECCSHDWLMSWWSMLFCAFLWHGESSS
jgi:hypothetical protein